MNLRMRGRLCMQWMNDAYGLYVTVHAYVPSNGICRGSAFKYGKFLLPPRFLTALSVPTVPTREQLLSLSHISIKIAFSYSCHDADTIFPVSFIFTSSSFRAPCLFLLDRNGPNVSSRSRRTIYIQTKPPECSSLFYIIPTRSPRLSHKKLYSVTKTQIL